MDPIEYMKSLQTRDGEEVAPVEEAPVAAVEPEEEEADDPELDKAREAVLRKYGKALTEGMSNEQIKAFNVQIAADLKMYNDKANEVDRLKKAQSSERHDDEGEMEQDGDAVRPSTEPNGLDLSKVVGPLDTDFLGEELPKALTEIGNLLDQRADMKLRAMQIELADNQVRRDLEERFPSVRDPATAAALREKMALLEPGMEYADGADIVARRTKLAEHAMILIDPNAVVESQRSSTPTKGGPRPPENRGQRREVPLTHEQKQLEYQRLRWTEGKSAEEAKRLVGLPVE